MLIRRAEKEDCNKLDELLTLLIRDEKQYDDSIDDFFAVIGYYENFINDLDKCLLVAVDNEEIIGYIYGYKQDKDPTSSKSEYLLDALYVIDNYRNQGIGKSLINEFKKFCVENNATHINVNVCSKNIGAKTLYQSNDFETTKETMTLKLK